MIFFFQAEDGIRDRNVTGVQTCALPIYRLAPAAILLSISPRAACLAAPLPPCLGRRSGALPGAAVRITMSERDGPGFAPFGRSRAAAPFRAGRERQQPRRTLHQSSPERQCEAPREAAPSLRQAVACRVWLQPLPGCRSPAFVVPARPGPI